MCIKLANRLVFENSSKKGLILFCALQISNNGVSSLHVDISDVLDLQGAIIADQTKKVESSGVVNWYCILYGYNYLYYHLIFT